MFKVDEEKRVSKPATTGVSLPSADGPDISVFLPVLNEEPNLRPLQEKLDRALAGLGRSDVYR